MVDQPGVRFGLASGALVLSFLVAAALPLGPHETASLGLVTAAGAGATLPYLFAGALGLEAWAFYTGFFENQYGALTLSSHDLLSLAGFVAAAALLAWLQGLRLASGTLGDGLE
jgi:hypothetical protein